MSRLFTAAGSVIDRVRINAIALEERDGREVWVKRRRAGSNLAIGIANAFFRVAGNPVSVVRSPELWQKWEVECFQMLNGDAFCACAEGPDAVWAEQMPGESLCRLLDRGDLTAEMMRAAGRELRRAHGQRSRFFEGLWSHGDPHLGNFIFDTERVRCRLIDFEVTHHRRLSAGERHADDLLVPLLDLCGRIEAGRWIPMALDFLAAYDRPEIVRNLRERLTVPRGMGRLWWAIRTGYISGRVLAERVEALRAALE